MVQDKIKAQITAFLKQNYDINDPIFEVLPTNNFKDGDLYTNVALKYSKEAGLPPLDLANALSKDLSSGSYDIKVVKPGFVNFYFSDKYLLNEKDLFLVAEKLQGESITLEYTDPNPFKVFHIGHLFPNVIGESLSRIFDYLGADVRRVNYQGDVGMHVAKSIWGLINKLEQEKLNIEDLAKWPLYKRTEYLGSCYAYGNRVYDEDTKLADEIKQLNVQIFIAAQQQLIEDGNWVPVIDYSKYLINMPKYDQALVYKLYTVGKSWSLDHFEEIYEYLGTNFGDKQNYYFESKVGEIGYSVVSSNIKNGIFKNDDGAVIFPGSEYGLHNRVFINSQGLPTYESKDLGLAGAKYADVKYDKSYIITANEIDDYFKVVLKAMSFTNPELAKKTTHLSHGMLTLKSGKMSSRTGTVITGESLIKDVREYLVSEHSETYSEETIDMIVVAAVKFMVLKVSVGKNIVYDFDESLSFVGFSGPYVQYTHARCQSVLSKSKIDLKSISGKDLAFANDEERLILRQLSRFNSEVVRAAEELSPHYICHYLYDLCQQYNSFYSKHKIITGDNEAADLVITSQVAKVIKVGLDLLGIKAPLKM